MISCSGYLIQKVLYQNSRYAYYQAIQSGTDTKVIIKSNIFTPPSLKDISRLKHEYEILKDLNIDGVIRLEAKVDHANGMALVIKKIDADPLTDILKRERLEVSEVLGIALSLTKTIEELHGHNIIHKDIQPENIFVGPQKRQTWIVDLSVSSLLTREMLDIRNFKSIEGNLAYISPEQTGRMNRPIDYRTDFYSLGTTLYEMLTGQLPFNLEDPLELVHSHLAKQPLPPHQIDSDIPNVVSDIVLKLLSKNAEERYQSTLGIRTDLENCIRQLNDTGFVERFPLGREDRTEKFHISHKLYGREREREILLKCFNGTSQGNFIFLTVAGYSGVGKTSLVRELYKPVTRERGYFVAGKFDEFHKNIPYSALVSAFQELISQILTESEDRLKDWKVRVQQALGSDSHIITEVIPDVAKLIDPQREIIPLAGDESQRKFSRLFLKFLRTFCSADHPLVIFLDDMQWIDPATLELINRMARSEDLNHLLLIGAYRDNEVLPGHPLMISLSSFQGSKHALQQISLSPLHADSVLEMIADTIQGTIAEIQPLADIVYSKTHGNPFFVNQFLTMLHQKKVIHTGGGGKAWAWNLADIETIGITDNVVDLLVYRLKDLPLDTQNAIRLAACIGFQFDLKTLSLIIGCLPDKAIKHLQPVLQEEMIIPAPAKETSIHLQVYDSQENVGFRFQHDRIQQAAYSLVDDDERTSIHHAIGKILLESMPDEKIEEEVFDVLSHLNFAVKSIHMPEERIRLAGLNLKAGLKAISTAAFEPALTYLKMGLSLLDSNAWKEAYDLTLGLHSGCIEAARLDGRFEEVEDLFQTVCLHVRSPLDAGEAYMSKIRACMMQNKMKEAYEAARRILNFLGEDLPELPEEEEVLAVLGETLSAVGESRVEDLLALPEMKDGTKLAAMNILSEVVSAVFIGVPQMFPHVICKQVILSITYGNTAASAFAYTALGAVLCRLFDEVEKGYRFGRLAVSLIEKLNAVEAEARVYHAMSGYINHYKEPIQLTMTQAMKGYNAAMETGDFEFAGYNAYTYNKHALLSGRSLSATEKEMNLFSEAIRQFKQETPFRYNAIFHQTALNLMGRCENPVMLTGEAYDERAMLKIHEEANDRLAIIYFRFCKLMLCTFFHCPQKGIEHADLLHLEMVHFPGGPMAYSCFYYFDSLVRLALFRVGSDSGNDDLKRIMRNQKKLKYWGDQAPVNYAQKYHLVEAELYRVQERNEQAIEHYDKAIAMARANKFVNDEALAYELAARFWISGKRAQIAKPFFRNAYDRYLRWGATSKTSQLLEDYADLMGEDDFESLLPQRSPGALESFSAGIEPSGLDMATIMKATQAISSELVLDKLLVILMQHCIENAGAEKGTLLLMVDDEPRVAAQSGVEAGEQTFKPFIPLEQWQDISSAIISYTVRSQEPVVLNNAVQRGMFTQDPYILESKPRSVLCFPILHKSILTGLLYLENSLLAGVFTIERIEIIKILSSQMGISIENARYYEDRKKAEEEYRGIFANAVEGIYRTTSEGRFVDVNPAAAKIFGYETPEEIISNVKNISAEIYVNPEDRKEFVSLLQKSPIVKDYEVPFYKKGGEIVWVSLNARKIVDEKGDLKFIEGFIKDVTIRKQATDILIEQDEQLRRENILLRSRIKDRYRFGRIVGKSKVMQEVYELIIKAAASDESVIIYGESGTGKELVARAIHETSNRKQSPFIAVNCGAIPENLMESEFFGYHRGAFTGANSDREGYLDRADKGILFLDELEEIALKLQVKLLRVLEGAGFTPLGSGDLKKPDFRVIAASNRDLERELNEGTIREDFFYRIHIIPIRIPPLRERKEDIPLLIEHFLNTNYPENNQPKIPGNVIDALEEYDWPGNIREFQNTLNRYITLKKLDFLTSRRRGPLWEPAMDITNDEVGREGQTTSLKEAVFNYERVYIQKLLEENRWHRGRVSKLLGIDRKTLYRKMSNYGL